MPSTKKVKEITSQIWEILKVLSVLFLMTSTIISALVWFGVNVFFPNSIAIEITKYFLLVLIPSTISAIMLQACRKSVEKRIDVLNVEIPKIKELHTQFQNLANSTQEMHKNLSDRLENIRENLQYFNNTFAIQCLNPNCRKWISIPIPSSLVKEIHYVDGRPTGKKFVGREMQVTCENCKEVFHIVYP
jgi:hypothetical protein